MVMRTAIRISATFDVAWLHYASVDNARKTGMLKVNECVTVLKCSPVMAIIAICLAFGSHECMHACPRAHAVKSARGKERVIAATNVPVCCISLRFHDARNASANCFRT